MEIKESLRYKSRLESFSRLNKKTTALTLLVFIPPLLVFPFILLFYGRGNNRQDLKGQLSRAAAFRKAPIFK